MSGTVPPSIDLNRKVIYMSAKLTNIIIDNRLLNRQIKRLDDVVQAKCHNDLFVKIGITVRSIQERFSNETHVDIRNIVHELHTTLYHAYLIEQLILTKLTQYKFYSNTKFNGYTECLQDKQEVLNEITNIIQNNNNQS